MYALIPVLNEMAGDERIKFETREVVYEQDRVVAREEPNLELFTAEELAVVDRSVERLSALTATESSDLSHEFPGWQFAWLNEGKGATIPYESVFWSKRRFVTDAENEHARLLAKEFGLSGQ